MARYYTVVRKKTTMTQNIIRVLAILIIFIWLGKSDKAAEIIALLPFAQKAASFFGLVLNPKYQNNFSILYDLFRHMVISMLAGTVSFVFTRIPPIPFLLELIWPCDDPDYSPQDFTHYEKGMNTRIRDFFVDLLSSFIAVYIFDQLVIGSFGMEIPGLFAVLGISVVIALISVIRQYFIVSSSTTFYLIRNSHLAVGGFGFVVYSILMDMIKNFLNTLLIVFAYSIINNPDQFQLFGTLILIVTGIIIALNVIFN